MQERSAKSRGLATGLRRAGRAAAFLAVATGINGVIAAYFSRYESIYVYLAAITLIALSGGLLLGVSAAVAAVILYDWMFSPVQTAASLSIVVPLTVAVVAALATRAARIPFRPRAMLAEPVPPPLLTAAAAPAGVTVVDDERVAELEQQLEAARAAAANESRLRTETEAAARLREAQMQRDLEALRARPNEIAASAAPELEALRSKTAEAESRAAALHQELDLAWRKADEERARADREATLKQQLEAAGRTSLQQTIAELSAKHEGALAAVTGQADETAVALAAAQKELGESRKALEAESRRCLELDAAVAVARAEAEKLRNKAEKLRVHLEEERARAAREAEMRQGLQSSARENLEQTIRQISTQYESELAQARNRDELQKARIAELEKGVDETRLALNEAREHSERESSLRAQLELAARETLQRTANIATEHQRLAAEAQERMAAAEQRAASLENELTDLRAAMEQEIAGREAMLRLQLEGSGRETLQQASELAALHQRLASEAEEKAIGAGQRAAALEAQLDELRTQTDRTLAETQAHTEAVESELLRVRALLESEALRADRESERREEAELVAQQAISETSARYEAALSKMRQEVDDANAVASAAGAEAAAARSAAEVERTNHETTKSEFDQKLQAIVAGITTDHEHAIGEALVEKESARAEVRKLTARIQELQHKLLDLDESHAALQRTNDQLQAEAEEARRAAEQERARRETSEAQWNTRLQEIVAHLASDHESDVGDALAAKEEARAEARNLTKKITALQERLESDRDKFRQALETWTTERGALQAQLQAAQQREGRASTTPTREEPLPPERAQPLVLIVHSDAGVRAMSKHTLEQAGYSIVTAADGLEGLRTASQQRPDAIVTEAIMPKMNGRELIQLLKSKRETAGMKIVLLTGAGWADAERGFEYRADQVVENAADFRALRDSLATVLSR